MKAILIAAGMGRRLSPYTDDRPKCMVEVHGRPMLLHQIDNLRRVGVREFVVIRGYLGDRLTAALASEPGVRFVDNFDYPNNNILLSLMCAADELSSGFFCSYGDIIYRPEVTEALAASQADIGLVVDPFFAEVYEGRTEHPIAEAELADVREGRVRQVGKKAVPLEQAKGEFIGLWRASARAGRVLRQLFEERRAQLGLSSPYGRAPRLQVAYLTDLFNDLIAEESRLHIPLHSVEIARPQSWREIDTVQDLERAHSIVRW
jgi:choline kinase